MANGAVAVDPVVARIRRTLVPVLGGLWLLDSFLQMQPGMFTMDMISTIMQPTLQGQPAWLAHLIAWSIRWVSPHVGWWNWGFAGIQFVIAFLLLSGRPRAVRAGLVVSVVWGLLVWVFGEGLGGILTGSATMLTGAPGSVVLYVWLGLVLLLPDARWSWSAPYTWVRDGAAALWLLAAAAQATGGYWTGLALSSVFQSNASMQPAWLAGLIAPVVALAAHAPVLLNALIIAVMTAVGLFTLGPLARPWAFWLGWAFLAGVWVFGQGFGMILTGMGTDPNAAPLWALLMWPGYLHAVARAPARTARSLSAAARSA
ncbi:MAG: hypothetical protein K6V97_07805 [Actinomycetia bacterium]|nr:hypothetical protein [Actinomycetes bacterium]